MTDDRSPESTTTLKAVASANGKLMRLEDVAKAVKKTPAETRPALLSLLQEKLVAYYLTVGFAITPLGHEALTRPVKQVAEGGTFAHRSVGSRMPAAINVPDAQVASDRKIEKMKEFAAQRARTRARLRTLAQETIGQRRPLRTLRD